MKKWRSPDVLGFTLMELMTVVFIIGILAAVAVPMLVRYMTKAKTAEAHFNLRKIYDGEVGYYEEERTDSSGHVLSKAFISLARTPTTPGQNKLFGNFSTEGWEAIKFAADGPVQYGYSVVASGTGTVAAFTARAEGDLDGDGTLSIFERVGSVDPESGEVQGGGAIFTLEELE
jgi:type IV pilus assembly protein PilA